MGFMGIFKTKEQRIAAEKKKQLQLRNKIETEKLRLADYEKEQAIKLKTERLKAKHAKLRSKGRPNYKKAAKSISKGLMGAAKVAGKIGNNMNQMSYGSSMMDQMQTKPSRKKKKSRVNQPDFGFGRFY